ncbi:ABC transporter permease [Clostridiaceae bacterium M8S5]|nr:ABC transporter permease [Clostridiaceae bacterium M8S5]
MNFKLIYLSLKNLRYYYFVPVTILYVFLPILDFGIICMNKGIENSYFMVFRENEKFIPLFSIWWIIFAFREYIEGQGNELLYCFDKKIKIKIFDIFILFLWYIIHVGILFIGYSFLWDSIWVEFLKTFIQCFFFVSATYMLIYTIKSTTISFMFLLLYELVVMYIDSKFAEYISIFEYGFGEAFSNVLSKYIVIITVSVFFLIIGVYKNKRYYY